MHRTLAPGTAAIAMLLASGARPAAAQTQTCQNTISVPGPRATIYAITAKGVYCLTTDLILATPFVDTAAISIDADNVVLDLNGHRIGATGTVGVTGVRATGHRGITVKNGLVRGFHVGISLVDGIQQSRMNVVEDMVVEDVRSTAISVAGDGAVVRRNRVRMGDGGTGLSPFAIVVNGANARIVDNQVIGDPTALNSTGIYLATAPGSLVEGNQLGNDAPPPANAVWNAITIETGSESALVVDNRIANWSSGITATSANVKCRDNVLMGVTSMLAGCTDAGNNN